MKTEKSSFKGRVDVIYRDSHGTLKSKVNEISIKLKLQLLNCLKEIVTFPYKINLFTILFRADQYILLYIV